MEQDGKIVVLSMDLGRKTILKFLLLLLIKRELQYV